MVSALRIASASRFATLVGNAASVVVYVADCVRFSICYTRNHRPEKQFPVADCVRFSICYTPAVSVTDTSIVADCVRFSICYTMPLKNPLAGCVADCVRFSICYTYAVELGMDDELRIASASRFATLDKRTHRFPRIVADCVRFSICYTQRERQGLHQRVADCVRFSICYTIGFVIDGVHAGCGLRPLLDLLH